jgi:hypothetical protein
MVLNISGNIEMNYLNIEGIDIANHGPRESLGGLRYKEQ